MSRLGNSGPFGSGVFWPNGLELLSPKERAEALERGWWDSEDDEGNPIRIFKEGRIEKLES